MSSRYETRLKKIDLSDDALRGGAIVAAQIVLSSVLRGRGASQDTIERMANDDVTFAEVVGVLADVGLDLASILRAASDGTPRKETP